MTPYFDFDGVLHLDPSANQFKFRQRNPIEGILREFRRWTSCFPQSGAFYPLDTSGDTFKHHSSSDIAERIVGSRQIQRAWIAIRRRTAWISNTQRAEEYDGPRKVFEGGQK